MDYYPCYKKTIKNTTVFTQITCDEVVKTVVFFLPTFVIKLHVLHYMLVMVSSEPIPETLIILSPHASILSSLLTPSFT